MDKRWDAEGAPEFESEAWLADLLDHLDRFSRTSETSDLERAFDRLVGAFEPEQLLAGARLRLGDLGGERGEVVLRLIEAYGTEDDRLALAAALIDQAALAPERLWEAVRIVEAGDDWEIPEELAEQMTDIEELLEAGSDPVEQLIEELGDHPFEVCEALDGLHAIEADLRPEIIRDMAGHEVGEGAIELLRVLSHAKDPALRVAAVEVLGPLASEAGLEVSELRAIASRRLESAVSAIDSRGVGMVGLIGEREDDVRAVAVFHCDLIRGVTEIEGRFTWNMDELKGWIEGMSKDSGGVAAWGCERVALLNLAEAVRRSGPSTTPSLQLWLELTAGSDFEVEGLEDEAESPTGEVTTEIAAGAAMELVLGACPALLDDSELTKQLAKEMVLRGEIEGPDPKREAGAYRFLFERRIQGRLEWLRRALVWMGRLWREKGELVLASAAEQLQRELGDSQSMAPGHPIVVTYTTESLKHAMRAATE